MRQSFECKEEYTAAIHSLKEFTAGKQAGFLLTYADVERVTGFHRGTRQFDHLLRIRFVAEMRKHRGIVLSAVASIGYRFMTADEVVGDRIPGRFKRAGNQLRRGEAELETATRDLNKIKDLAKRRLALSAGEYLQEKRKEINSALRQMRKTETLPTRKPV